MKRVMIAGIIVVVGSVLWFGAQALFPASGDAQRAYLFTQVEKRDMVNSISATGTLSAVVTVEVGSEVSGQLKELMADYNSQVTKNQVIARINPDSYQTLVRQAEAELEMAKARLATETIQISRYQADLVNMEANWEAAKALTRKARVTADNRRLNLERQKLLVDRQYVAKTEYDQARAAYDEAVASHEQAIAQEAAAKSKIGASRASLMVAQAALRENEAQVLLKEAALDKRKVDLQNTIIRSPVEGVVIDRNVNVGQTVAASLTAPVLFTIAQDLREMQVSASVDEADIGQIKEGLPVRFTVDAFGNKKFTGEVIQIRKLGKTVQNVVTYEVIISAENHDLALMPGMTADVEIIQMMKPQVLAVANAALRFSPPGDQAPVIKTPSFNSGLDRKAKGENVFARPLSGGRTNPEEKIKHYTEQLNLTETQQEELKAFYREMGQKARTLRESTTSSGIGRGGRGTIREKMRKQTQAAMTRILTPSQKALFDEIEKNPQSQRGTLWYLDKQGDIKTVGVRLGTSDTSFTEILGGRIEPGMRVITKIKP